MTSPVGPEPSLVAAIVPAAGAGVRLGPGQPKALRCVGGVPILVYAVGALLGAEEVDHVVVACPEADIALIADTLRAYFPTSPISCVVGGATRQDSVRRALAALSSAVEVVLVHDAARPFAPADLITAVVRAVWDGAVAVVPGLAVVDTIKEIDPDGQPVQVVKTVDRSSLRAVQTPQGFRRDALTAAHEQVIEGSTDDAGLVERLGLPVTVVPGSERAFKITNPLDLVLAEGLVAVGLLNAPIRA